MRTGRNGLGDIAGKTHAAVSDQWHAAIRQSICHILDGRYLRNANTRHHARSADGAWTDADLDTIRTVIHQGFGSRSRSDVAADYLDLRIILLDPLYAAQHALRVTMGGIHHQHIHAGFDQQCHALFRPLAHADCCTDAQASQFILAGQRMFA